MKTNMSNILRYILPSLQGRGRGVGLLLLAAFFIASCADLDSDKYFGDRKTLESVFTDREQVDQWLAHAYSFLTGSNFEVCSKGGTGGENSAWNPFCFADDIYYGDRDYAYGDAKDRGFTSYNTFREGGYTEAVGQDAWVRSYQGIYQASIFIKNIDQNTDLSLEDRQDKKGQARFVRAYYYWLLLRKFGPVPIMPNDGADYTLEYDDLATPRSTYEECANYIAEEMVQAAKEISPRWTNKRDEANIARPTRGACLATRAIALTYAASPLANGQLKNGKHPSNVTDDIAKNLHNFDGTPLLSLDYDEAKWARAAAACKDVMDLGGYELYHAGINTVEADGAPLTVEPDYDPVFSENNWPRGWKDIDPYLSYRNLFNGTASAVDNPELIFTRGSNMSMGDNDNGLGAMVAHSMPVSLNGWNTHGMTQKMCDTYYMRDGSDVPGMYREWRQDGVEGNDMGNSQERPTGWTSRGEIQGGEYPELSQNLRRFPGMNVSKQYVRREPRFYASVAFSGSYWEQLQNPTSSQRNAQIFYYRSGGNGYINAFSYLRTGIGIKKFYHPDDFRDAQHDYSHLREKFEPAIRYADILLMYAECLNELTRSHTVKSWQGQDITVSRDIDEIKKGIQPVRIRAGLHDYTAEEYGDANLLRAKIKRERMIEFMGEGKRYFDLRRWMDAPVEENKRVYGLNVFQTSAKRDEFMQVIPVYNLSANFNDKMYFWPISHTDLKRNKNLVQNPGWTYND